MRIWWVVDAAEYWLEPEYSVLKNGRVRFVGCKLFDRDGVYKGYWLASTWPSLVRKQVREAVVAHERRNAHDQRAERVRMRSYLGKTK